MPGSKKTNRNVHWKVLYYLKEKHPCDFNMFPAQINSLHFFYFILPQDESSLNEFVREHPDINLYVGKLNEYLRSSK
jgi:hypothetical protein